MKKQNALICMAVAFAASLCSAVTPFRTSSPEAPHSSVYSVTLTQGDQTIAAQTFQMEFYEDLIRSSETSQSKRNLYLNLYSGRAVHWTSFELDQPVAVEVTVTDPTNQPASGETAKILPSRKSVTVAQPSTHVYRFTLTEPGQYSLEIGQNGYKQGLLIFADPVSVAPPDTSSSEWKTLSNATANDLSNLPPEVTSLYFEDGAHDIGVFNVPAQIRNIYLERGAWVYGAIRFTNSNNSNVRAWGRGVLDGIKLDFKESHLFEAIGSANNITLDGWVICNYTTFAVRLLGSDNIIKWAKLVSGWNHNSDGIAAYHRSKVNNCFIWANDDNIKLYRDGMTVEDCVCWQLDNGAIFQLSWGSYTQDNISVKNVDIIRTEFTGKGKNHGIINARGGPGAIGNHSNFTLENITVETPTKSIIKLEPEASEYTFDNFVFKNWNIAFDETNGQDNTLRGTGSTDAIRNFTFENLTINGTPIVQENSQTIGRFQLTNATQINFTHSPATDFEKWARSFFTFAQLAEQSISARTSDPDNDGLNNEMEYLIGTRPFNKDIVHHNPSLLPVHFSIDQDHTLDAKLEAPANADDINWQLLRSSDLKRWQTVIDVSEEHIPISDTRETVVLQHKIHTTSPQFFQVKADSAPARAKNVLLIMADDFNYWTGTDGYYPAARTPNIDRLARKGVFFNNAHSVSPVCHPSRNALWSGVSPLASGIDSNGQAFIREVAGFEDVVTLNQYFKENGYYVYGGGKLWHPGRMDPSDSDVDPNNWTEINPGATGAQGGSYSRYQSEVRDLVAWSANPNPMTESNTNDFRLANDVTRFLDQMEQREDQSQPFFIGCGFFRPHLPWNTPKEFWDLFDREGLPRPSGANIEADLPGAVDYFKELYDAGKWEEGLHAYLAACALADHNVGVLLDALESSPYADNTIVLIMGDHGWQLGEKGRWGKFSTWQAANKTTFIVYDPSAPGNGQICAEPVTLQDVYPTLVELTDLPAKTNLDGRSLLPLLEAPQRSDWNLPIVMQYSGTRYTQDKEWRFIENGNNSELFHLSTDPYEQRNLYGEAQYNEVVARMRAHIAEAAQLSQDIHSGTRKNPFVQTR